jgi:hypothetical protein
VLPVVAGECGENTATDITVFRRNYLATAAYESGAGKEFAMNSCIYDRVFLVPNTKDSLGWARRGGNKFNPETEEAGSKISIAWWLVPSVIAYLVVSVLVFG